MSKRIKILVAEPSDIIRSGMVTILFNLNSISINVAEIGDITKLKDEIYNIEPDFVIINPQYLGLTSPMSLINQDCNTGFIALQCSLSSYEQLKNYDATISILDTIENIENILRNTIEINRKEGSVELSEREKEIVIEIAKGLSNKEISDKLFISEHTVKTHRKNIASKLDIRNPSALTIYAIVNKLIKIDDIK